jgi:hypothetical protein
MTGFGTINLNVGVLKYKDKVVYEGEWKNDVKCGKGTTNIKS